MIEANIRRIQVDPVDDYLSLFNKNTGNVIYLPRGRDVVLQLGYFEKRIFVPNPSHLATITAEVRPSNRTSAAVVTAQTSSIAQIAEGQWEDDTSQHASILLPAAQTASLAPDATTNEKDYWLVITALTTGGKPLTLISGRCVAIEDGGNYSATVPNPGDPTYVTAAQFFSALSGLNAGEFTKNGWRVRLDVDANGQVTFNTTPA